jgi:hypothetical protein
MFHSCAQRLIQSLMVFSLKLVWPLPLAQVLPRPKLIFPSKTWIFGIYLNFSVAEIT